MKSMGTILDHLAEVVGRHVFVFERDSAVSINSANYAAWEVPILLAKGVTSINPNSK